MKQEFHRRPPARRTMFNENDLQLLWDTRQRECDVNDGA